MLTTSESRQLINLLINAQKTTRSEIEKLQFARLKSRLRQEIRDRDHYEKDMADRRADRRGDQT